MQRADGGVVSGLLLFTSTPQSNLRFASSPAGEPFGDGANSNHQPALKGEVANEVSRRGYKEAHISPFVSTPQSRLTPCQLPVRGAFRYSIICQDIRVNALVGTRSPYSLPFVILPVPARSPFRLLVHRTRSTPNLPTALSSALPCAHSSRTSALWP